MSKTKVYVDPKHSRRGLLVYIVHYNLEKNVALIEDYFNYYSIILYAGEIAETLHFMVSPVERRVCTFDDLLPCIEKITLLSEEEDRILGT